MTSIIDTLNGAYDIEEGRPWWRSADGDRSHDRRGAFHSRVVRARFSSGPTAATHRWRTTSLGSVFDWTWKILQWPIVFVLASAGIAMIYYFAPDAEQDWVWLTPGSIVATPLWLVASLGFKYYVANLGNYTETYGAIGGVMVLLLWFYISGLVILIGAEMNAEIEHASPYGKAMARRCRVRGARSARPGCASGRRDAGRAARGRQAPTRSRMW